MVRNRTIQIRITKDEYERIGINARTMGFETLSAYVRYQSLARDWWLERKICELHAHLIGDPKEGRRKKRDERPGLA